MPIVTISRGSYNKGKEVAEKVANRLDYRCTSRDVLLEASDQFHIPEIKLVKAIHDAPSILDRFTHGKQNYISFIKSALTKHVCQDNIVYHGFAGHIFLKGISHVLKIRIIGDLSDRVAAEMERENVTEQEAEELILKDDKERRKWTKSLFGVDPWDPALYDLIIHIQQLQVDDAVDFICQATEKPQFQATPDSHRKMEDLALACALKARLVEQFPEIGVKSAGGNVIVYTNSGSRYATKVRGRVSSLQKDLDGINNIEVHESPTPPDAE